MEEKSLASAAPLGTAASAAAQLPTLEFPGWEVLYRLALLPNDTRLISQARQISDTSKEAYLSSLSSIAVTA